jgi:hypothetical protein
LAAQVLHVYWFFLILKVAQRAVTVGIEVRTSASISTETKKLHSSGFFPPLFLIASTLPSH